MDYLNLETRLNRIESELNSVREDVLKVIAENAQSGRSLASIKSRAEDGVRIERALLEIGALIFKCQKMRGKNVQVQSKLFNIDVR